VPQWAWTLRADLEQARPNQPPLPAPRPVSDSLWRNLRWAWVNTPTDIGPDLVAGLGYQAAIIWAHSPVAAAWVDAARRLNMKVAGWHRCTLPDPAQDGQQAANTTLHLALDGYALNIEAEYDTFGNSNDTATLARTGQLLTAFHTVCPQVPLAAAVTPRWTGDHNALREHGCCLMPEAYPGEVPDATVKACVDFAELYGWLAADVRPLFQVYPTDGVRPSASQAIADAHTAGVRLTPYPIEASLDDQNTLRMIAQVAA
jgi:hypothetical protein